MHPKVIRRSIKSRTGTRSTGIIRMPLLAKYKHPSDIVIRAGICMHLHDCMHYTYFIILEYIYVTTGSHNWLVDFAPFLVGYEYTASLALVGNAYEEQAHQP